MILIVAADWFSFMLNQKGWFLGQNNLEEKNYSDFGYRPLPSVYHLCLGHGDGSGLGQGWDMVMGHFPSSLSLHLRSSRCCGPFRPQFANFIQCRLWAVDSGFLAGTWFVFSIAFYCPLNWETLSWGEGGRLAYSDPTLLFFGYCSYCGTFAKFHRAGNTDLFALQFPDFIRESIQPFPPFLGPG